MIIYVENPRESTKIFLEFIGEFSKVVEYKVILQKPMAFLKTSSVRQKIDHSKKIE